MAVGRLIKVMRTPTFYPSGATLAFDYQYGRYMMNGKRYNLESVNQCVRSTTGTALSSGGTVTSFAINAARRTDLGVVSELQRTNLFLYSQQFDNGNWSGGNYTVSANAISAPDGTTTMDAIIENTSAGAFHYIKQSITKAASSIQYITSYFVKDKGREVILSLQDTSNNGVLCRFNPATGVFTYPSTAYGTGFTAGTAEAVYIKDGIYRLSLVATSNTATNLTSQIALYNGTTNVYTGDGVSGVYLWGGQLETAAFLSEYIPTTSASVTCSADSLEAVNPLGNLLTYSEDFTNAIWNKTNANITSNATTAPDGTTTADKVYENTVNAGHYIGYLYGKPAAALPYTYSIYTKAAERSSIMLRMQGTWPDRSEAVYNLSTGAISGISGVGTMPTPTATIENVGSGWYRCSISVTTNTKSDIFCIALLNGGIGYLGDGASGMYFWGAQLTPTAYPVPYVKTTATQANLNTWYNTSAGTVHTRFKLRGISGAQVVFDFGDGSSNNLMRLFASSGTLYFETITGGVQQCALNLGTVTANVEYEVAVSWSAGSFDGVLLGGAPQSDTSGTIPTVTKLRIGESNTGGNTLHGRILEFNYIPYKVSL